MEFSSTASSGLSEVKANSSSFDDTCALTNFDIILNVLLVGSISLFGIIGNSLSVYALNYDRSNKAAVMLLQSLACSDSVLLVLMFITISLFSVIFPSACRHKYSHILVYCYKFVNPVGYMAQAATIWMTVLIAMNRFVAICKPFEAARWLTPYRTRIQIFVVILFAVALNIHRFFQFRILRNDHGKAYTIEATSVGPKSTFSKICNGVYTALVLVCPLILMIILKVKPTRELFRMRSSVRGCVVSGRGRSEENISLIMLFIIIVMVACHTPDRIHLLLITYDLYRESTPFYFANVCNFLVAVNSSSNFVLYFFLRPRFRRILRSQVCCLQRRKGYNEDSIKERWSNRTGESFFTSGQTGSRVAKSRDSMPHGQRAQSCQEQK